jgi:hypothetical protein
MKKLLSNIKLIVKDIWMGFKIAEENRDKSFLGKF